MVERVFLGAQTVEFHAMTMLRNRVKEMRMIKAADLVAHEANWRTHPPEQVPRCARCSVRSASQARS